MSESPALSPGGLEVCPMKLRTQIALAFLLLAVLPLGGIVLYSYVSSEHAFRQAVWSESQALTEEMTDRLAATRQTIRDRITRLGKVDDGSPEALQGALDRIGAADLPFVESLELMPETVTSGVIEGQPVFLHRKETLESQPLQGGQQAVIKQMMIQVHRLPPPAPSSTAKPEMEQLERAVGREVAQEIHREFAKAHQAAAQMKKTMSDQERQKLAALRESSKRLVGDLSCPLTSTSGVVGRINPHVKAEALFQSLFAVRREQGEVPFALDEKGTLYVAGEADRRKLADVPISCDPKVQERQRNPTWVVVTKKDAESGLCFGAARPIRKSLAEMRNTAVRNFSYGLGLVGLCFLGIFPLSGRMTRNLSVLTEGVERLGHGDLTARVPVGSQNEIGRLGAAFNRMAAELHENQERLLEQERLRKEREIERRLLEAEHARKSGELEQARQFQLSLLPRELPRRRDLELAVYVRTATEVGGDYYDFLQGEDGGLVLAIGDATGHGAASATMVTVVKGLFTGRAAELAPAAFLGHANEVIRRLQLGRMAMALSVLRLHGGHLTASAAGMPPLLIHRAATGAVEEVCLNATPLGARADSGYPECEADLAAGDTLLLMTDGFPELLDPAGDPLGYPRASELFAAAAGKDPEGVIADLTAAGEAWAAGAALHDDVTFVVVKVR
jgi:serine phosphatase RsbU (regulator of sigma subunit)